MKEAGQKIITPYVSLDTPGKATVQVVILADPVSITIFSLDRVANKVNMTNIDHSAFCLVVCRGLVMPWTNSLILCPIDIFNM